MKDDERIIDKIQKLLAKAESTNSVHEAEALFAKAQEWMIQYAIDEAKLIATGKQERQDPVAVDATISDPYFREKARLLYYVAKFNGCKSIRTSDRNRRCTIVGMPKDIEFVQILFSSLLIQLAGALTRIDTRHVADAREYRKGFVHGFVNAIYDRLYENNKVRQQAEREVNADGTSTSTALVLLDQSMIVKNAFDQLFPNVTYDRPQRSRGSWAGQKAGQSAGRNADVSGGRGRVSGTKGALNR